MTTSAFCGSLSIICGAANDGSLFRPDWHLEGAVWDVAPVNRMLLFARSRDTTKKVT